MSRRPQLAAGATQLPAESCAGGWFMSGTPVARAASMLSLLLALTPSLIAATLFVATLRLRGLKRR